MTLLLQQPISMMVKANTCQVNHHGGSQMDGMGAYFIWLEAEVIGTNVMGGKHELGHR
jgi:hypothetical protein